ncbi:MAG: RdgB/HAM1 family non-canonical purine NTP pyrophosphatase [Verrucomicrobia bacterium]|mgnify:FL=1|nr:RdgB/HAM1 family non-canonical purine NTP pyrophosphatase [Verrucomicrobiota bacterium]MBT7971403.1 RdgB/HAM1 family non-canonical purine NTP pyrophosphatase [Verrucomicrobiota bacterium]MDB4535603.1 RdgB/HAM1 family non-canonical purine NTP pyrophosphatase [bacterium]MDB4801335.1 RdgB/HAM1 family non-canonical purine NTP pyrophosphatase [Akkermansiaceae bacterium]MDC0304930.1 RdgB/HAM1 family non-canonical purine NTP pyrophosphatase [bacterium]
MKQRLIVATRNVHKVEEIRAILSAFEVLDLSVLTDPPEVEETGSTFLENAILKAQAISELTDALVLSDDSGLEVDSLGGDPGVYSARYAGEDGNDFLNNEKLLREMDGQSERTARFRCVIVLARGGNVLADFSGAVEGHILQRNQGEGGFGYDPLFVPEGYERSFAELGEEIKNGLSHRSRALEGVVDWLRQLREID